MDHILSQVGGWSGAVGIALAVIALILLLANRVKIQNFVREVKVELAKATWPWDPKERGVKKYKELIDSTLIVVIAMLLLSGYVAIWDFLLNQLIDQLTR